MKNIKKAKGLRRRCCKRVTVETQKERTRMLREEADVILNDIEELMKNTKTTNIGCGFILSTD